MKKSLTLLLLLGTLAMVSCNPAVVSYSAKECRCYELANSHWTGPHTRITSSANRCSDLNSRTRLCNEMDEPIIDPNDIGVDEKKRRKK